MWITQPFGLRAFEVNNYSLSHTFTPAFTKGYIILLLHFSGHSEISNMISPSSQISESNISRKEKSLALSSLEELNQVRCKLFVKKYKFSTKFYHKFQLANLRMTKSDEEIIQPRFVFFNWYTSTVTITSTSYTKTTTFTLRRCTPAGNFAYAKC